MVRLSILLASLSSGRLFPSRCPGRLFNKSRSHFFSNFAIDGETSFLPKQLKSVYIPPTLLILPWKPGQEVLRRRLIKG